MQINWQLQMQRLAKAAWLIRLFWYIVCVRRDLAASFHSCSQLFRNNGDMTWSTESCCNTWTQFRNCLFSWLHIKLFDFICYLTQVIMAQEEILKKEKELEMARRKLETIRKAKYRPDDDTTGSELWPLTKSIHMTQDGCKWHKKASLHFIYSTWMIKIV